MMQRSHVVGFVALLLAAACTPDRSATGPTAAPDVASRQALTATEAVPDSLAIFPPIVVGGAAGTPSGTVYVSTTASVDRLLQVTSDNPTVLPFLPSSATVPAGSTRANVLLIPSTVSVETVVTLFVTGGGVTVSATLTVEPPGTTPPAPVLASMRINPNSVAAGTASTGTVVLASAAPAGGVVIQLSSFIPGSASVPATVTVPAGATTANFPITTSAGFPNSTTSVRIFAKSVNNVVENFISVITGDAAPAPLDIASIAVSPTSVVGGNAVQGMVTLSSAAPSGGTAVTLSSSNTAVATTPASVTVPAGATAASFTIATAAVTSATSANISGNAGAGWLTTTLSVTPVVSGPPSTPSLLTPAADARFAAGSTVTFDWNDASNAASYTIQISDTDKLTSLLVNQTVSVSRYAAAALPTKRLWWRVRANAASGATSAWSAVRRFELK